MVIPDNHKFYKLILDSIQTHKATYAKFIKPRIGGPYTYSKLLFSWEQDKHIQCKIKLLVKLDKWP